MHNKNHKYNLGSSQVSFNLRNFFKARQKVIKSTAFKSISFNQKCDRNFDILPGKLLCLKLQNSSSIDSLFSQKNVPVLIFGDVSIVELSVENHISYCLGILLSSGMFFLYEYDKDDRKKLYFRIGLNVRGAKVLLSNEIITVKSNIDIVIRVKELPQIDLWFQKFCQACTGIDIVGEEKSPLSTESLVKISKKPDTFKNHFHHMRDSWKLHNSMMEISKNSWNFDQGFLAPLTTARNSNLTTPVVSDEGFVINSQFKITSTVLARISPSSSASGTGPFVEGEACLTQHILRLTLSGRTVEVMMSKCNLETIKDLKWGIRVNSPTFRIEIELTSKVANERWTLAFMKIFSFHSNESRSSLAKATSDAAHSQESRESGADLIKDCAHLHRCLSQSILMSHSKCYVERLTKSCHLLTNITDKCDQDGNPGSGEILVDDIFTHHPCATPPRSMPQRTSSCLDFPIPIIPDIIKSKPHTRHSQSDSSCSETNSIYDDMESPCCDFERHFIEQNSSSPLPVRCKKHGIGTRIRRSCQFFTKMLTKSSDLGKIDRGSKYSFLRAGVISNKFRSEDNLQRSGRSGNHGRVRGHLSDVSRSVYDIRSSRFFGIHRDSIDGEILEDEGECEVESDEYEEPVSGGGGR